MPVIAARSRAVPFAFFVGMMTLQIIAAFFLMPEMRGAALERMMDLPRSTNRGACAAICDTANGGLHASGRLKTKKIFNR
jgi:hypothetical protein